MFSASSQVNYPKVLGLMQHANAYSDAKLRAMELAIKDPAFIQDVCAIATLTSAESRMYNECIEQLVGDRIVIPEQLVFDSGIQFDFLRDSLPTEGHDTTSYAKVAEKAKNEECDDTKKARTHEVASGSRKDMAGVRFNNGLRDICGKKGCGCQYFFRGTHDPYVSGEQEINLKSLYIGCLPRTQGDSNKRWLREKLGEDIMSNIKDLQIPQGGFEAFACFYDHETAAHVQYMLDGLEKGNGRYIRVNFLTGEVGKR